MAPGVAAYPQALGVHTNRSCTQFGCTPIGGPGMGAGRHPERDSLDHLVATAGAGCAGAGAGGGNSAARPTRPSFSARRPGRPRSDLGLVGLDIHGSSSSATPGHRVLGRDRHGYRRPRPRYRPSAIPTDRRPGSDATVAGSHRFWCSGRLVSENAQPRRVGRLRQRFADLSHLECRGGSAAGSSHLRRFRRDGGGELLGPGARP